jgi:hypothetical protein
MEYDHELSKKYLAGLAKAVESFEADLMALEDEKASLQDKALVLWNLKQLVERIRYAYASLETEVARGMFPGENIEIPGAVVEKRMGKKRTAWDHDTLKSVVAETVLKHATNKETGEIASTPALIRQALNMAGISYWKVTELKKAGLKPSLYCSEEPGNISVVFH